MLHAKALSSEWAVVCGLPSRWECPTVAKEIKQSWEVGVVETWALWTVKALKKKVNSPWTLKAAFSLLKKCSANRSQPDQRSFLVWDS